MSPTGCVLRSRTKRKAGHWQPTLWQHPANPVYVHILKNSQSTNIGNARTMSYLQVRQRPRQLDSAVGGKWWRRTLRLDRVLCLSTRKSHQQVTQFPGLALRQAACELLVPLYTDNASISTLPIASRRLRNNFYGIGLEGPGLELDRDWHVLAITLKLKARKAR